MRRKLPNTAIAFGCATLLAALFGMGCEHELPLAQNVAPTTATFSRIQANILLPNCAVPGCHVGATAPLGLDMSIGRAYGNLVNVQSGQSAAFLRVNPGDADNSYFYMKVLGDARISRGRMPLGGSQLSQSDLDAIRDWINDGAQNN